MIDDMDDDEDLFDIKKLKQFFDQYSDNMSFSIGHVNIKNFKIIKEFINDIIDKKSQQG